MRSRSLGTRVGYSQGLWAILFALLIAVVVPTACVLWFMTQAMRNERLAVRQKLQDAYRGQLVAARNRLDEYWREKAAVLTTAQTKTNLKVPSKTFADLVEANVADSVVIHLPAPFVDLGGSAGGGDPGTALFGMYPQNSVEVAYARDRECDTPEWLAAAELEYENGDLAAAAQAYAKLATESKRINLAARALLAQARCLAKAGQTKAAIDILTRTLAEDKYRGASDVQTRYIQLDALLRGLQLMGDPKHPDYHRTVDLITRRLNDYGDRDLRSAQRRFLMHQLQAIVPDCPPFPTLAAEDLAAQYLETSPEFPESADLTPTPLPGIWQFATQNKLILALFRQDRVVSEMQSAVAKLVLPPGVTIRILPPKTSLPNSPLLAPEPASDYLPDWQLAIHLEGSDPFAAAADRQMTAYLWTGVLVIIVIAILAMLVASYIVRQVRLTGLKNDLIATVSHELKTPLASMRVLADTLLAGNVQNEQQAHEYVQLMARENERLSHLIDNFLTFSRMERNKRSFEFAEVNVGEIVASAVEAVGDRLKSSGCRLEVDVAPALPPIVGDRGALVTVLINLLDNAYKYTEDDKHVIVRAYSRDGGVCLEVQDNGIGLSRRVAKKVFDRFYQVDQSLSRRAGGCGLGLSIVKFIVEAHGGSVSVTSRPGEGSTFTVTLPSGGPSL